MTAPIIERTAHTAASRASNRPAKIARALGLPKSEPLSPRPDFCSFSNANFFLRNDFKFSFCRVKELKIRDKKVKLGL